MPSSSKLGLKGTLHGEDVFHVNLLHESVTLAPGQLLEGMLVTHVVRTLPRYMTKYLLTMALA